MRDAAPTPDPTFLVIGAQKCATTWLAEGAGRHPDVFVPETKELHFFNKRDRYARGLEWYRSHFSGRGRERAAGEFTPNYFWTSDDEREIRESGRTRDVPALVHEHYPDLRLVLTLRDPVDRAVSAYFHHIHRRRIAPGRSILDVGHRYGIVSMGRYHTHLTRWLRHFDRDRFLILVYEEDIRLRPAETMRTLYDFLGVDPSFEPTGMDRRYNPRPGHLYLRLNHRFPWLAPRLRARLPWIGRVDWPRIEVTDEEKRELARAYRDEVRALESLLGRSLERWKRWLQDAP